LLRRGAVGGGALLVSASGLTAFAGAASAATIPDADLAYLRLLVRPSCSRSTSRRGRWPAASCGTTRVL
jgi:hypothetical protein